MRWAITAMLLAAMTVLGASCVDDDNDGDRDDVAEPETASDDSNADEQTEPRQPSDDDTAGAESRPAPVSGLPGSKVRPSGIDPNRPAPPPPAGAHIPGEHTILQKQ